MLGQEKSPELAVKRNSGQRNVLLARFMIGKQKQERDTAASKHDPRHHENSQLHVEFLWESYGLKQAHTQEQQRKQPHY